MNEVIVICIDNKNNIHFENEEITIGKNMKYYLVVYHPII